MLKVGLHWRKLLVNLAPSLSSCFFSFLSKENSVLIVIIVIIIIIIGKKSY